MFYKAMVVLNKIAAIGLMMIGCYAIAKGDLPNATLAFVGVVWCQVNCIEMKLDKEE